MPRRIEDSDHYTGGKIVFGEHRICTLCRGRGIDVPMSKQEAKTRRAATAKGQPLPPRWPCELCGGSKLNGRND